MGSSWKIIGTVMFLSLLFSPASTHAQSRSRAIEGQWKGKITRDAKEWSTEVNIYPAGQELTGDFDLPDYGLYHMVFSSVHTEDSTVRFEYTDKKSKALFNGAVRGRSISGQWQGLGMSARFTLEKESDTAVRLRTEEVSFTNGDATLAGTLVLPVADGPVPAIVQVHGSGNQTRGEDFYRSRAYLFARNGIAVLIYDRRGKGASSGPDVSMELLADDAVAGVHLLQRHPSIDKGRIGIMGFSQGGYVGPLAASRTKDVAFLIAGSAPGVTPDEQNDFDVENELRSGGVVEDSIAYVLRLRKELRNYQDNAVGDKHELEESLTALRSKAWYAKTQLADAVVGPAGKGVKEWLTFDPLPAWRMLTIPVLLIWGELDDAVPVARSRELIESALKGSANYTSKVYKGAGHGLAIVPDGKEWDWPRLAGGYHQMLIDWTRQHTTK